MMTTHSARRINYLADALSAQTYLEIGVEKGLTFFDIEIPKRVAVDPEFRFNPAELNIDGVEFYSKFSDNFFESYSRPNFDIVFLDGLHTFEQTARDFLNCLTFTGPNSVIVIDDVWPSDVFSALRDHGQAIYFREMAGLHGLAWHGDVFKLVFLIHDFFTTLSFATIMEGGNHQTLIWRKSRASKPLFNSMESISRLNFFDMIKFRDAMNLMPEQVALDLVIRDLKER